MGTAGLRVQGRQGEDRRDRTTPTGFFTVGDVGYLNEDGYLFLCDRKSDMIIAGGVNIYPAEIEGVIHEHPDVADVAVFGIPDDDMGEQIKAVIEPVPGVAADDALRASIMEHIQGKLGKYKWPRDDRLRRRAPARAHRQAAEAQAPRPVLGRSRPRDLTASGPQRSLHHDSHEDGS